MSDNDGLSTPPACRIAIIGGGPGGLMTAYQLQQRCSVPFETTIFEATSRLGGKILTPQFASAPVAYEAGAAELYDYSHIGQDPLRELIQNLGLTIHPMAGSSVVLDGHVLHDFDDAGRIFGDPTRQALLDFDAQATQWMDPQAYYDSDWQESNLDPLTLASFHDRLQLVPDPTARRYLRTLLHSDLATEPHRTSASYGLQNYLMNNPRYMRLYTIEGGIERLPQELAARLQARFLFQQPVLRVERQPDRLLRVFSRRAGVTVSELFDFVVVALPNTYLPSIEWAPAELADAIHTHHVHYDYPAHYLRISILFQHVFWRHHLQDSYMMLDAFGGCCLYDESSRNGSAQTAGVLGWLLAGDAAMIAANRSDSDLVTLALDSLPPFLQHGRDLFLEAKVHRWIGEVNGLPAGSPALDMESRHIPLPAQPGLFVVGDYLFDSTLNGVLDSADYVAEWLTDEIEAAAHPPLPAALSGTAL